jgi:hypothetical protein
MTRKLSFLLADRHPLDDRFYVISTLGETEFVE